MLPRRGYLWHPELTFYLPALPATTFVYSGPAGDGRLQRTEIPGPNGIRGYAYGGRLLTQATTAYAGDPSPHVIDYTRNPLGQVTRNEVPEANYDYAYDAAHRLRRVTDGRLTEKWFPNGVNTQYQYLYDALDCLTEVQDGATSNLIAGYAYDPYGNRTQHSDGTDTWHYGYNAAHELETVRLNHPATGPLTAGYVHDANGNLTKQCEGGSVTRTTSNCTGSTVLDLQYNALDRLTQADKTGLPSETYGYDDQGRRIHKTVGANRTDYLYMGPDIHAEYSSGWGTASAVYTHGPRWDDPIIRATATTAAFRSTATRDGSRMPRG